MDTRSVVGVGVDGLRQIVSALEREGISVRGAYLISLTRADGDKDTAFRIVTESDPRDVIYKFVRIRRDGLIPSLAEEVRISPVRPNHIEAARVLEYAARIGTPIVTIRNVFWGGIFIEDAVVVKWPNPEHAVA